MRMVIVLMLFTRTVNECSGTGIFSATIAREGGRLILEYFNKDVQKIQKKVAFLHNKTEKASCLGNGGQCTAKIKGTIGWKGGNKVVLTIPAFMGRLHSGTWVVREGRNRSNFIFIDSPPRGPGALLANDSVEGQPFRLLYMNYDVERILENVTFYLDEDVQGICMSDRGACSSSEGHTLERTSNNSIILLIKTFRKRTHSGDWFVKEGNLISNIIIIRRPENPGILQVIGKPKANKPFKMIYKNPHTIEITDKVTFWMDDLPEGSCLADKGQCYSTQNHVVKRINPNTISLKIKKYDNSKHGGDWFVMEGRRRSNKIHVEGPTPGSLPDSANESSRLKPAYKVLFCTNIILLMMSKYRFTRKYLP